MLNIIKLELYKLIHSKGILYILIVLIIMTVSIYGFWMKFEGSVSTCYAVEIKGIDDKEVIEQAIQDVVDMGYFAHKAHGAYVFNTVSMVLFIRMEHYITNIKTASSLVSLKRSSVLITT